MTVIIRLQNLPWTATALDIRRFFSRLTIPDGGVHIVGGDLGDAFIAFATDEDARKAMMLNGHILLENPVALLLSSKTEMQTVIAKAREAHLASQQPPAVDHQQSNRPVLDNNPPPAVPGYQGGRPDPGQMYRGGGGGMGGAPSPFTGRPDSYGQTPRTSQQRQPFPDQGEQQGGMLAKPSMAPRSGDAMSAGQPWNRSGPPVEDRPRRESRPSRFSDREFEDPVKAIAGPGGPEKRNSLTARDSFGRSDNVGLLGHMPQGFDGNVDESLSRVDRSEPRGRPVEERSFRGAPNKGPQSGPPKSTAEYQRGFREADREPQPDFERPFLKQPDLPAEEGWDGGHEKRGGPPGQGFPNRGRPGYGHSGERGGTRGRGPRDSDGRDNERFREQRMREEGFPNRDRSPLRGEFDGRRNDDYPRRPGYEREGFEGTMDLEFEGNRRRGPPERGGYGGDPSQRGEPHRGGFGPSYRGRGSFRGRPDNIAQKRGRYDEEFPGEESGGRMGGEFGGPGRPYRGEEGIGFGNESRGPGPRGSRPPREQDPRSNFPPGPDVSGMGGPRPGRKRGWEEEVDLYVIVENLPQSVSYRDVRRFFVGCEIPREGLKLINDETGHRIGVAYVMFSSTTATQEALYRDGKPMNGFAVRVSTCTAEDFESAVDSFVPYSQERGAPRGSYSGEPEENCIEISNVPYRADKSEIKKFFSFGTIAPDGGPVLETGENGRSLGIVVVKFERYRDFKEAMGQNNTHMFGRTVHVKSISLKEFEGRTAEEANKAGSSDRKVRDASRDSESRPSTNSQNRPKPNADAQLVPAKSGAVGKSEAPGKPHPLTPTRSQVAKPRVDSKSTVSPKPQTKTVEANQTKPPTTPKQETKPDEKALLKEGKDDQKNGVKSEPSSDPSPGGDKYFCVKMEGLPPNADGNYVREFTQGLQTAQRGIHVIYNHQRQAAGMAFVEFITSDHCQKAIALNNTKVDNDTITVTPIKKRDMVEEIQRLHTTYRKPPNSSPAGQRPPQNGVIISMSNVHFRARVMDIVRFFDGFNVRPPAVRIQYAPNGNPKGEATVMVPSQQEAKAIMRECNYALLMGRTIQLDFK